MTLKPMQCPNCGGAVNEARMICEYCGTRFESDLNHVIRVVEQPAHTRTYQVMTLVPNEYRECMGREDFAKHLKHELSYKLAEALAKEMDVMVEDNPMYNRQEVRARVRVVTNDYRF